MRCPDCSQKDTKVLESRLLEDSLTVRRRRKCDECEYRFTTYERFQQKLPEVVKSDGRREEFNREKILKGLSKSCQKRPISSLQLNELIDYVEEQISKDGTSEVKSDLIGDLIMTELQKLDPVAYVRFASFYWNFQNSEEFMKELSTKLLPKGSR